MPNLLLWAGTLPPAARVVVLDVTDIDELGANSAMELRALLIQLAHDHRHLIVAGIGGKQFEQLRRAGAGELLGPENVCPDLDLAIARALNVLERSRA